MLVLLESSPDGARTETAGQCYSLHAEPHVNSAPMLLEYRGEEDPDAEFIPKTVAGFAGGALAMGVCLGVAAKLLFSHVSPLGAERADFLKSLIFMLGIVGVSTSLLLVGLKVRADHCASQLYSRHWLNSISTGAGFAVMMFAMYGLYVLFQQSVAVNRFLATVILMAMLAFPVMAARWTVGPHKELLRNF